MKEAGAWDLVVRKECREAMRYGDFSMEEYRQFFRLLSSYCLILMHESFSKTSVNVVELQCLLGLDP